jgi:hypothetical protein
VVAWPQDELNKPTSIASIGKTSDTKSSDSRHDPAQTVCCEISSKHDNFDNISSHKVVAYRPGLFRL